MKFVQIDGMSIDIYELCEHLLKTTICERLYKFVNIYRK